MLRFVCQLVASYVRPVFGVVNIRVLIRAALKWTWLKCLNAIYTLYSIVFVFKCPYLRFKIHALYSGLKNSNNRPKHVVSTALGCVVCTPPLTSKLHCNDSFRAYKEWWGNERGGHIFKDKQSEEDGSLRPSSKSCAVIASPEAMNCDKSHCMAQREMGKRNRGEEEITPKRKWGGGGYKRNK